MRSVRRTTWKIRHEVVTVVRCHIYGAANAEAFGGVENAETADGSAWEREEQIKVNNENCLEATDKREKDHE